MSSVLLRNLPTGPAVSAISVTPHDTNPLAFVSRALWVGVAGDVKVTMADGQAVTFKNLTVGWHPLSVSIVWDTGTGQGAGDIIAVS